MTDVIHILSLAKHFDACGIERSIFVWNQINSLCQSFHNKKKFKLSGVIFVATLVKWRNFEYCFILSGSTKPSTNVSGDN
jgi:hypothetical protein